MRSGEGTGGRLMVTVLATVLLGGALTTRAQRIDAGVPVPNPIVVTNAHDAGAGSLRQAMLSANANADPDTITFAIAGPGPFVIELQTPLPVVSHPVVIDGLTQAGATMLAPQVFLDGAAMQRGRTTGQAPGIEIQTGRTTIHGLGIGRFPGPGVYIGPRASNANRIEGCVISGNAGDGILIVGGGIYTSNGPVGAKIAKNTISHNTGAGISVRGGDGINGEPPANITITQNAIFGNTGIGIDLGGDGPTLNPLPGQTDTASNPRQNYPVVIAVTNGRTTSMDFSLDGPAGTYTIEYFSGASCGAAEKMVTGTSEGIGRHRVDLGLLLPIGTWVVATATGVAGNTSELSACGQVRPGPAFTWWMSQGPGEVTTTKLGRDNGVAQFTYQLNGDKDKPLTGGPFSGDWTFTTVAKDPVVLSLDWSWTGFHSRSEATARLEVFVNHQGRDVSVIPLVDAGPADCCSSPSGGFAYTGTTSVVVGAGDTYGFRLRGSSVDAARVLRGTFDVIVGIDGSS